MAFKLSKRSLTNLTGVHPDLNAVVYRTLSHTTVDFAVLEGLRLRHRQAALVKAGASKTMDSRHLTGHAVDLGAWVNGTIRWDWPLYLKVAEAVRKASIELGTPIRWGGTWGLLSDLPETITMDILHKRFPDGPHFELPRSKYP